MFFGSGVAMAQAPTPAPAPAAPAVSALPVPGFWDPRRRPERPDTSRITLVRFLTEIDFPPFNYAAPDGNPAGLNVDLARLICEELKVQCTVQMRRFDTLIAALADNRGDAAIASISVTELTRERVDFTEPYYRPVARFAALKTSPIDLVTPVALEGRKVAVVAGTAQETYLRELFTEAEIRPYANKDAARDALRRRDVDLIFDDGFSLAFWLNGTDSGGCCTFKGGPYTESRYFGEGIGIAVKKGNDTLSQAMNWAMFRLWEKGRFVDLWLRYFPISPF
ncbi:MAG: transporter substrate-binding domain-containing protein [Proteobacteria bacterium]|nr:transporter substrate-binding domain-containing protein [Pseudomonadota bacterium]